MGFIMEIKLGVQLFSVRESMRKDPYSTIERLAQIGFKNLEGANGKPDVDPGIGFDMTVSAEGLRRRLDSMGVKIVGNHISNLNFDVLERVLEFHKTLGNRQIGCDIVFFPYGDMDYVKERCEFYNKVGEKCAEYGMRFYYHNHFQEFQRFAPGGQTIYDFIMEHTDPELVKIELDTFWVARAGLDPVEYIRKYKDRLILLHQKDFVKNAAQPLNVFDGVADMKANIDNAYFQSVKDTRNFTEIGTGILPIQDYINAAKEAPHLEYILLEQDYTQLGELESVEKSMEGFSKLFGINR